MAFSALSALAAFQPMFSLMQICHQLSVSPPKNLSTNHSQISLLNSKITSFTLSLWIYIARLLKIGAEFLLEILNSAIFIKELKI